jgi:hypothetical protein
MTAIGSLPPWNRADAHTSLIASTSRRKRMSAEGSLLGIIFVIARPRSDARLVLVQRGRAHREQRVHLLDQRAEIADDARRQIAALERAGDRVVVIGAHIVAADELLEERPCRGP